MEQRNRTDLLFTIVFLFLLCASLTVSVSAEQETPKRQMSMIQELSQMMRERPNESLMDGVMPCRGEAHLLVINVIPEESEEVYTSEEYQELLFGTHYSEGADVPDENITDYFDHVSYGKLHVTGKVVEYKCQGYSVQAFNSKQILMEVLRNQDLSELDANKDHYLDGVFFLVPSLDIATGYVHPAGYQLMGGYRLTHCAMIDKRNIHMATVCHESIHLMGFPDLYADEGFNPAGTNADTIMEGKLHGWSEETGWVNSNVPGILKFFFGWLDEIVEVSETGVYELGSFSTKSQAMVLYPNGNTESDFFFLIEFITPDGNDKVLSMPPVMKNDPKNGMKDGVGNSMESGFRADTGSREETVLPGLRIWRVLLNGEKELEKTHLDYFDLMSGTGYTPFVYLDTIPFTDGGPGFFLREGDSISDQTTPSLKYFTEITKGKYYSSFYDCEYKNACYTLEDQKSGQTLDLESGLSIDEIRMNEGGDTCELVVSVECSGI